MFNQYAIIFDQQWQSYTLIMSLALIISFSWMLWQAPAQKRGAVLDGCLAGLIGAILLGRIVHVALNWVFFSENVTLIWQLWREGGLNGQAAIIGALIFGSIVAHFRGIPFTDILKPAVLILPLMSFASWYACATAGCAYGQSIDRMADYPQWLTWLAPDIYRLVMPRFATQALGMGASLILLIIAILLYWQASLIRTRFWLMLIAIAILSFSIGFLRGDYSLIFSGLRAGQILDVVIGFFAIIGLSMINRTASNIEIM